MANSPVPKQVLRRTHEVVRPYLRRAKSVTQFHASLAELTPSQRALLVRQAIMLVEGFYVNLPLKCAMYAVDPLRRLRLLQHRLTSLYDNDRAFHREMIDIFTSLCDQHANYFLPVPYKNASAWLPFKVDLCYEREHRPCYLVSRIADGYRYGTFRKGVEIVAWNGVPIDRAVEVAAALTQGSNLAGRRALALMSLTARVLSVQPPPDEEWVIVEYRKPRGGTAEIRIPWAVSELPENHAIPARGVSVHVSGLQHVRRALFAPSVVKAARKMSAAKNPKAMVKGTESTMPDVFRADTVNTPSGTFGYVRIYTFDVPDSTALVDEFVRLIAMLPKSGLIIDVRDNPGGRSRAAEELLQLIVPMHPQHEIEPERLNFINTPLTLELCKLQRSNPDLGPKGGEPWINSIALAIETGATYSSNYPYSDREALNARGRLYPGPAIVLTSALSRSAAEVFAAGFQDHGGKVLGVDEATGGAGSNARTYIQLAQYFTKAKDSPFRKLPMEADFQIPFRRFQRVGLQVGNEIEDFGVKSDYVHLMTRDDILNGNVDLINCAARLLRAQQVRHNRAARRRKG